LSTADERNVYGISKIILKEENCKYLEKNLPQCHFVYPIPHMDKGTETQASTVRGQ